MSPALSTSDSDVSDDNSLDNTSSYADDGSRARSYGADGKRHACPHCYKRFNRPSSLEIHINTHTGVRPFRCPHPDCGKDFNVKSNMRRHYKNHFTTAAPSSPYGSASVSYDPPAVGSDLQIIRCHQYPASASATYAAESRAPNREGQRRRALSWEV
ncbi:hypothetical protein FA95DRAFT_1494207 [Auriscalpium vulgare]|uniref:Uncharacterized protein n=1 Tax=Auriscalpium vulgare TaxID=40419 RepID=A0ACB8RQF5_9AGAM|nr:hypothetical protein FA95DRAFT_1494207 [Auriscalpium vulgare]